MNNQKLITTVRKGLAEVKEQKIGVGVEVSGLYPNIKKPRPNRNYPRHLFLDFKFEFSFGIASAAGLLYWISGYIGLPYFVTNRTVGNKYINILCLFCAII